LEDEDEVEKLRKQKRMEQAACSFAVSTSVFASSDLEDNSDSDDYKSFKKFMAAKKRRKF
jgi:hypothetical protein